MKAPRGMSLIELLAALAISALLLGLAAPNLAALVRSQQLNIGANDLLGALAHTRTEAMARGTIVMLAPLDPLGQDFARGWVIFIDRNGDRRPGAGEEVLAERPALADGLRVHLALSSSTPPQYIAYNGAGRSCSHDNGNAARFGTLSLFHGDGIRRIKINMLGRARLCDPARSSACDGVMTP